MKFTGANTTVNIDLPNGIYILGGMSGEGKTRLYKIVRQLMNYTDKVLAITYDDTINNISRNALMERLKDDKYNLIIIDRYNLYNGFATNEVERLKRKCIILIDYKGNGIKVKHNDLAVIDMAVDKIEVYK